MVPPPAVGEDFPGTDTLSGAEWHGDCERESFTFLFFFFKILDSFPDIFWMGIQQEVGSEKERKKKKQFFNVTFNHVIICDSSESREYSRHCGPWAWYA